MRLDRRRAGELLAATKIRYRRAVTVAIVTLILATILALPASSATFTATTNSTGSWQSSTFPTHSQAMLTDSATGYWRLNDTPTAVDHSTSHNNGLMYGPVSAVASAAGDGDTAGSIPNPGGIAVTSGNYVFAGTSAFTVEVWIQPTVVNNLQTLISCAGATGGWILFNDSASGSGLQRNASGASFAFTTGSLVTVGSAAQVVGVHTATQDLLYLNGSLASSAADNLSIPNSPCTLRIALPVGGVSGYQGYMDEASIYSTALSAARINAHFNAYTAPNYATNVLSDNPTGYWRFEENARAVDSSTTAGYGTFSAPGVTYSATGGLSGSSDTAMAFDGTAGILVGTGNYRFPATGSFSVEAWVYPTTVDGTSRRIAQCEQNSAPRTGWYLYHSTSGVTSERAQAGTSNTATGATALTANTWAFVTMTYDGTTLRTYVNATQVASTTSAVSLSNTACTLRVGSDSAMSAAFVGTIDEVAVFATALTSSQIANHYQRRQ